MIKNKKTAINKFWHDKRILITGGASFIGSNLVDTLLEEHNPKSIRVVDNLSSGLLKNINSHIKNKNIEFVKGDLRDSTVAKSATKKIDVIFHLAADHGGRGYVDLHQAGPASNFMLDGMIFREALKQNVKKIVFASSGCVYPNYIQTNIKKKLYLTEELVVPPYDADNLYGWAKLMAELTLKAYHQEYGMQTASCRYFTVYGPRGVENHAVIAMIARSFIKQNPYQIWGDGQQIRNWTYINDIVSGTIKTAEKINNGTALNLGTMERIKVIDAVNQILNYTNFHPKLKFLPTMPTGPVNRVADNKLAKRLLNWEPKTLFSEGVKKTIDWYYSNKKRDEIEHNFSKLIIER